MPLLNATDRAASGRDTTSGRSAMVAAQLSRASRRLGHYRRGQSHGIKWQAVRVEATQRAAKEAVRRLVAQAINENKLAVLDEICSRRLAAELRGWFSPFRAGFPDWRQEIIELVAEGSTVVARCTCQGTNLGSWLGVPATGRSMQVDEVWFFNVVDGRLDRMWSLEDTWSRLLQLGTAEEALQAARTRRQPRQ